MTRGAQIFAAVEAVDPQRLKELLGTLTAEERKDPDFSVATQPNASGELLSALMLSIRLAAKLGPSASLCRDLLLGANLSAAYVDPFTGRNAAHEAAEHGIPGGTWDALARQGVDLNLQSYAGDAPLHLACENHRKESVLALLHLRADPNVRNHDGDLPVHSAVRSGNAEAIATLVKVGRASLNVRNNVGLTPLGMACVMAEPDPSEKGVAAALLGLGADPNMECHGKGLVGVRPLELAFTNESSPALPDLVQRLLTAGACPDLATAGRPSLREALSTQQAKSVAAAIILAAPRAPNPETFLRDRLATELSGQFQETGAAPFSPGANPTEAPAYSPVSECYLAELEFRYPTAFAAMENGLHAETPEQSRERARRATMPESRPRPNDLN